jgi:hypothetical protein
MHVNLLASLWPGSRHADRNQLASSRTLLSFDAMIVDFLPLKPVPVIDMVNTSAVTSAVRIIIDSKVVQELECLAATFRRALSSRKPIP